MYFFSSISQKIISSVASLLEYLQELSRHEDELSLLPETLRIEFEQSVSSEEALRANIEKALLQGVALNIVDLMMACSRSVHLHPFTLEEVLLDTISHTLQNARYICTDSVLVSILLFFNVNLKFVCLVYMLYLYIIITPCMYENVYF